MDIRSRLWSMFEGLRELCEVNFDVYTGGAINHVLIRYNIVSNGIYASGRALCRLSECDVVVYGPENLDVNKKSAEIVETVEGILNANAINYVSIGWTFDPQAKRSFYVFNFNVVKGGAK